MVPSGPFRCLPMMRCGHSPVGFGFLVLRLPGEEHHDIGVLLQRPRFAQVRQPGLMVFALVGRATELRKRQHRDVEVLGECFRRTRNRTQFQGPVVLSLVPGHQLEVVDDHQVEPVAAPLTRLARARMSNAVSADDWPM